MNLVECSASTSEYVAVHAAMEPSRPAIVVSDETLSYGLVFQHIRSFTLALHNRGIKEGDRCIVNVAHPYVHWLILLALENLAAVSCSARPEETDSLKPLFACMNKLIGQMDAVPDPSVELVHLPIDWIQAQLNARPDDVRYREVLRFAAPQTGQRIKRSSGTTGGMKLMLSSNQGEEALIKAYSDVMGFTRDSRYLVANGFVITSVHLCSTLCLRLGGLVIFDQGGNRFDLIKRHHVTHVRFFPQQLLDMLKKIETENLQKPENLTVILGAAPVSSILWNRVLAQLATNIVYTYNANECGSICVMGPDGLGAVRAGVQVSIVGPDDQVLPPGQPGRIRVKVPHMVQSYIDNPSATQRNFKDGWFYTGDAGQFIGPRRLKLMGRIDDVLVLAGFKRGADEYEADASAVAGVQEACALTAPDAIGLDRIVLCVVPAAGADQKKTVLALRQKFPPFIAEGGRVFFVEKLPRTDNGKLQRAVMKKRLPQLTGGYAL